ncbi:MAG: hypothetical protein ACW97P_10670 [Candidatus Hodarchaeales archaeon]|jgi:hypothetical protein
MIVKLHNLILFTALALWRGTPFHLWKKAWRECEADHLAEIRKAIWELKCQGLIREDESGYLFAVGEDND